MNNYTRNSLRQALENQVRRLENKITNLDQLSGRLSMVRLGTFIGGLFVVYLVGQYGAEWLFWLTLAAFFAGFWKLVNTHKKIDHTIQRFSIWKSIRETHLGRLNLDWSIIPATTASNDYANHPFARDLLLIGKHSLLQLIDTSNYQGSTDQLTQYLLNREPNPKDIEKRQAIVKALTDKPQFRDQLHLRAELYKKQELGNDWSLQELQQHLNQSEEVNYTVPLSILGGLSILNITLAGLYLAGILGPYVIFSLVLYLVIYNFNSEKISGLYNEAYQIEKLLSRFNAVLNYLESYDYESGSKLEKFCRPFWSAD
jgi:hypothetical protein